MAADPVVSRPDTLSPLPSDVRRGLTGVACLAALSLASSGLLFFYLSQRILRQFIRRPKSGRGSPHPTQFVLLILNLLLADIQQSCAFIINGHWLSVDSVQVGTTACWAQGWFVSTGDLASGVWALAIGLHTFSGIIFNYQIPMRAFYSVMIMLWVFVYAMALAGVGLYGDSLYVRAGAWCWVNRDYTTFRLVAHYLYIFIAEFGCVIIYTLLFITLSMRSKSGSSFESPEAARQAKSAAKIMLLYPFVYVICTLPLASLRMASESIQPSFSWFCAAGAMITSNGWLDVLVYAFTRRFDIDSSALGEGHLARDELLESIGWAWNRDHQSHFGNTTTIVANNRRPSPQRKESGVGKYKDFFSGNFGRSRWAGSTEELVQLPKATASPGSHGNRGQSNSRPGSQKGRPSHDNLGEVRAHQTVTITVEPMSIEAQRHADLLSTARSRATGPPGSEVESWDGGFEVESIDMMKETRS